MELEWWSDNVFFDVVLCGEVILPEFVVIGMVLFYGDVGCVFCYAGFFLTDY